LFDFIPYYGAGDASVDGRVRAMVQAAGQEELCGIDHYGNTLLILAAQYKAGELMHAILAKDCIDVNAVNDAGACALHFACFSASLDVLVARALIANGSKVRVVERTYGCTPLHYAAGSGHVDLCKDLVAAGAIVATCDFHNYTAVDYARQA
ncbi:ankyrin repeat-containing domain protein, partial [Tribonema minus]